MEVRTTAVPSTEPAPLLTYVNFPAPLKRYLATLPRPRIVLPEVYTTWINQKVGSQWHDLARHRDRQERDLAEALQDFPQTIASIDNPGRYLTMMGAFMHRILSIRNVPTVCSTSWVMIVPSSYPYDYPHIWFCWEQQVECTADLRPLRFKEAPYRGNPLHHQLGDGSACITLLEGEADDYDTSGWDSGSSDLGDFLTWSVQYLARREYWLLHGTWPSD